MNETASYWQVKNKQVRVMNRRSGFVGQTGRAIVQVFDPAGPAPRRFISVELLLLEHRVRVPFDLCELWWAEGCHATQS